MRGFDKHMKIKFIGPVGRVTGSCYHLINEGRGEEYLVDCGILQGEQGSEAWNSGPFQFDPKKIKHVFLTHAHIDHCGLLPKLYQQGYRGPVWCTRETAELAKTSLIDARHYSDYKHSRNDIEAIQWKEPNCAPLFNKLFPISTDLFGSFYRSAHLVGAVSFSLTWGPPDNKLQRTIVFSGDLGNNADGKEYQSLLKYRMNERGRDYVVCESTYGDKVRPPDEKDWATRLDQLAQAIAPSLAQGGTVVIPVFAIGRAQDVIFDLACVFARDPARYSHVDVVLDSVMAQYASKVYATAMKRTELNRMKQAKTVWRNSRLQDWLELSDSADDHERLGNVIEAVLLGYSGLRPTAPINAQRLIDRLVPIHRHADKADTDRFEASSGPRIVIATGGMCEAGPVVSYLYHAIRSPKNTVLFCGYQARGTSGGFLQDVGDVPPSERAKLSGVIDFNIDGGALSVPRKDVHAQVVRIAGYSGHADQAALCEWLIPEFLGAPVAPKAFLTHGEDKARQALKAAIEMRVPGKMEVMLPTPSDGWYDLDLGRWVEESNENELDAALARIRQLEAALAASSKV
jgi:metallo-beta-lactamase family protein